VFVLLLRKTQQQKKTKKKHDILSYPSRKNGEDINHEHTTYHKNHDFKKKHTYTPKPL
jgi:hypothetical protein